MPGEGIFVWHIDFTPLNMDKEKWVPISIVQADDSTTPDFKWWDNSISGLEIDCSTNEIAFNPKPYDYNAYTPYGIAEIKYEPINSGPIPPGLGLMSDYSGYLQYGAIKASAYCYTDNRVSVAIVVYNKNDEIITILEYTGNRYPKEMHLDADRQTLVISGQLYPTVIPLLDLAHLAFPPAIKKESPSSVSPLIPAGLKLDYSGLEKIPSLHYGVIKARVFSYVDGRSSFAVVVYNENDEIITILEYPGDKAVKELDIDADKQSFVISGQSGTETVISLSEIRPFAFPANSETETEEPRIKFESLSLSIPPGLKSDYSGYLQYGAIKASVYSYIDNRVSVALVVYNKNDEIIAIDQYEGNRYVKEMRIDEDNQTLVISGQFPDPIVIPLQQIKKYHP
jgi:HSP20 family molecular chaperone IbpA